MKKLLFLLSAAFLFAACTKNYYGVDDDQNPAYVLEGITNFSINPDIPNASQHIYVNYRSKEQENVTLSLAGVPPGLHYEIINPSGIPSFASHIEYYDSSAAPGVYDVKLIATGSISGKKEFNFTITVDRLPDCATKLAGAFNGTNFCNAGPSAYAETVTVSPSVPNRIIFNNFENNNLKLYADLRCSQNGIIIPEQTITGYVVSGYGNYYTNSAGRLNVYCTYTVIAPSGGTSTCNFTLSK